MLKRRKKLVTIILIFVLVFATTVTAYALSSTANLQATEKVEKTTSTLNISTLRMYSYNSSTSTNRMVSKLQVYRYGGWDKVVNATLGHPGGIDTGILDLGVSFQTRVKIYSLNNTGGVNGFGTLLDN